MISLQISNILNVLILGMVYLRLADICIEEGHLVRAERLLSSSVDILKKSKSISLEFSFTLTCARLSVSQRELTAIYQYALLIRMSLSILINKFYGLEAYCEKPTDC